MGGHVHVIAGDVRELACDAWLLPTDAEFRISATFAKVAGVRTNRCLPGHDWAGSRVTELKTSRKGARIWLGNIGRNGADAGWYAGVIEPFVTAAKGALAPDLEGRRPLLALNVIGTGEGGMRADKGAIHRALIPEMLRVAKVHDVDLVLVCWGRRAYSAAQRVRRQLLGAKPSLRPSWEMGPKTAELVEHARRLGHEARRQNMVLFLGAGVSAGAGLPGWQQLLDGIAVNLELDESERNQLRRLDVRDQAAILKQHLDLDAPETRRSLQAVVSEQVVSAGYALTHGLLASLPTREAVTTNYDRLFEMAATAADGRALAVLPYEAVAPGQRWLLKLHGSIERDDSIVLTRTDYLDIPARHGALFGLVQAMLLTRHMLFVGYSLSDEDFYQLIHEVRVARSSVDGADKLGTVLTLFDDELFAKLWGDVDVVAIAPQPQRNPTPGQLANAARWLQIFCDLVAFEAADLDAYLLDPDYRDLLDKDEAVLADTLSGLKLAAGGDGTAAARVRRMLEDLGRPQQ